MNIRKGTNDSRPLPGSKWPWLLAAFTLCLIPRLVFSFRIMPFEYATDEFSTLSAVCLIYPGDWSEVLSACCGYYGGGFSILLFPLFYLIKDPILIYRIMLVIMCLLQALVTVPAFIIAKKHFHIGDGVTLFLFSTAASYLITRRSNNVTNEHILYLVTWLIVLVLLELVDREVRKSRMAALSVLLGLLLAYAAAVHERGLVLICAFLVAFVLYLIAFRRQVASLLFLLPSYAAGYLGSRLLKNAILAHNFTFADKIRNTSIKLSIIKMLLNPANLKPYLISLAGSLTTSSLATCGLVVSAIVICFYLIFRCLFRAKQLRAEGENQVVLKKFSVCFILLVSGLIAVLLWQPLNWVAGLEAAVAEGWGSNHYSLKMLTYIRYYGNFISPAVMLGILWYRFDSKKGMLKYDVSMLILLALGIIWYSVILYHVSFSSYAWEAWMPFGGKDLFSAEKGYGFYRYGLIALAAGAVVCGIFIWRRWFKVLLLVLCAFAIFEYGYLSIHFDVYQSQKRSDFVSDWKILEETGICDEIDELYVNGITSMAPTMQFLFFDKTVHVGVPDPESEEGLVISTRFEAFGDALENGWMMADDQDLNAYVFVKGDRLVNVLEESGIRCTSERVFRKILAPEDFITGEDINLFMLGLYLPPGEDSEDSDNPDETVTDQGEMAKEEEKGYQAVVENETDTWKFLSPEDTTLLRGTYRFQLELDEAAAGPPKVQVISLDGNYILNNDLHSEDGKVWETVYSVLNTEYVKILISSDEYEPAITLARFDRLSDEFTAGRDSESDMTAIASKINEDSLFDEVVYICDRPDRVFNVDYVSEILPGNTVSSSDIVSAHEKKNAYVIAKKEDAWLSLTKDFEPVLVAEHYVLLSSRAETDGFVPIKLLQNGRNGFCYLPYGDYKIRSEKLRKYLKRFDGDVTFMICSADGSAVYYEGQVEKKGKYGVVSFRNDQAVSDWQLVFRHGDETINIKKKFITIRQTKTRTKIVYNRRIRKLIRILNTYPETGTLTIYGDLNGQSPKLVRQLALNDLDSRWQLATAEERDLNMEKLSADGVQAFIVPRKAKVLFAAVPDFVIAGKSTAYVLLLANTQQVKENLRKAGIEYLSDGAAISGDVFFRETEGQTFSVREGTYRLYCSQPAEKVYLYVPAKAAPEEEGDAVEQEETEAEMAGTPAETETLLAQTDHSASDAVSALPEEDETQPEITLAGEVPVRDGTFAYRSFVFTSKLMVRDENGEPVWIDKIEKRSDDYVMDLVDTVISGTYDPETDSVTGENEIRLETDPVPIRKNRHYLIEAELEGEPADVLLEFVNREFANEVIYAKSDLFEQLEDGHYYCRAVYHSNRKEGENFIRFAASFAGKGSVRKITVRLMNNAEYQRYVISENSGDEVDQ